MKHRGKKAKNRENQKKRVSCFISCLQINSRNGFYRDETSIVTGVFVVKYTLKKHFTLSFCVRCRVFAWRYDFKFQPEQQ